MKIIDIETKGNVFRVYLGDDNCKPCGDDWDDRPYESNAGRVYDEYIEAYFDYAVDLDNVVLEPINIDSSYSKEDLLNQKVAALAVMKLDFDEYTWMYDNFNDVCKNKRSHLIYLNDKFNREDFKWANLIKEAYICKYPERNHK